RKNFRTSCCSFHYAPSHQIPKRRTVMNRNITRVDGGNTACSPFDKPVLSQVEGLRANRIVKEMVRKSPFVLSLSKHGQSFFREPVGHVAVALLSCLFLWGMASPATAATIVVTTNQDIANPPFNTGGLCGNGTISNLPGADGKVSLREAIIA